MQQDPRYRDPVLDLCDWFEGRLEAAAAAGVPRERIALDPGFGFGKSTAHNLALLAGLPAFLGLGVRIAAGLSRKSWVAALDARALADAPEGRLAGSLAGALAAALGGGPLFCASTTRPSMLRRSLSLPPLPMPEALRGGLTPPPGRAKR